MFITYQLLSIKVKTIRLAVFRKGLEGTALFIDLLTAKFIDLLLINTTCKQICILRTSI